MIKERDDMRDFFSTIAVKTGNHQDSTCISEALMELLVLQDFIKHSTIPYFGKLLARLVGVDTIPIMLQTKDGFLKLLGFETKDGTGEKQPFITSFFRLEEIDKDKNCAVVS